MKLIKIIEPKYNSRISGTGSFPTPKEKDIGKEVIISRKCITWDGCLGYFKDDNEKITYAFYLEELK